MIWRRYVGLSLLGEGEKAVRKQNDLQETVGFSYPPNKRKMHLTINTRKEKTTSKMEKNFQVRKGKERNKQQRDPISKNKEKENKKKTSTGKIFSRK